MTNRLSTLFFVLIVFGTTLLIIDSCKSKKSDDIEPVIIDTTAISSCIIVSERINGVLLRTYEYDTTRNLVRMAEYAGTEQFNKIIKRYTFEYDKKSFLTRIRETNLAERDKSYIYELEYANSILETIRPLRVFNSGVRADDTLTLVYDDKKRISQLLAQRGNDSKWEYDSVGNIKKWYIRTPTATKDSLMASYNTYDNKVNIAAFSKGVQLINLLQGKAISKRNPLKYTFKGQQIEASYLYNNKRVPTEAILKIRSSQDTALRETVYKYDLNCK